MPPVPPSHRARDMARFAAFTSSMEETIEAGCQEEDGNQDLQDSMYIYIYIWGHIYECYTTDHYKMNAKKYLFEW